MNINQNRASIGNPFAMSQAKLGSMKMRHQAFRQTGNQDNEYLLNRNATWLEQHTQQAQDSFDFREQMFPSGRLSECGVRKSIVPSPSLSDMKDMSRKFAELRQHLINTYEGDALYEKLDQLSRSFEDLLKESISKEFGVFTNLDDSTAGFEQSLQDSLSGHMETFFTNFIDAIQSYDFYTAFEKGMRDLLTSQTTSDTQIGWNDLMLMREDLQNKKVPALDEDGYVKINEDGSFKEEWRHDSANDAFRTMFQNSALSPLARDLVSRLFMSGAGRTVDFQVTVQHHPSFRMRIN